MTIAVVALGAGQIWPLLMPRADGCSPVSTVCYDSGWLPVTNRASTVYFFRHPLGDTPRTMTLWFSPTQDGARAYLVTWKFPRPESGNPVTIEARKDVIYVHIWNGIPIHGAYDGSTQQWQTFTDGFYRVVAER